MSWYCNFLHIDFTNISCTHHFPPFLEPKIMMYLFSHYVLPVWVCGGYIFVCCARARVCVLASARQLWGRMYLCISVIIRLRRIESSGVLENFEALFYCLFMFFWLGVYVIVYSLMCMMVYAFTYIILYLFMYFLMCLFMYLRMYLFMYLRMYLFATCTGH